MVRTLYSIWDSVVNLDPFLIAKQYLSSVNVFETVLFDPKETLLPSM